MNLTKSILASTLALSLCGVAVAADEKLEPWQQAQKTEVWEPEPAMVSAPAGGVPSDAVVLVGNGDLSQWEGAKGGAAQWVLNNGEMTVKPGTGSIKTKQSFCDVQLHVEWKTPADNIEGKEGQERNNSGVFLQQRYEIQVLDSYNNRTYSNGQAAALYKQSIPLVNASRPPGQWQTYDIIFSSPEFKDEKRVRPGYVTVLHNGVLVQNHVEIQGASAWIGPPTNEPHGCAPIMLQDHGNPVSFRNMWVRKL
ncbi:3-keto-disaccharide hydrolase [Neptunicella marina]|uniref:DUF1080 domain-containing protein n=1 Tax=Neptunicella marina TaxID=2125989 RepID=A0A8J6LXB0_9ALTE|nr:DUF1080 domain-containing protein [Neptunicella marina]MBC3765534.1 DUF1080 domain-containing protein [Neptunicella marina]